MLIRERSCKQAEFTVVTAVSVDLGRRDSPSLTGLAPLITRALASAGLLIAAARACSKKVGDRTHVELCGDRAVAMRTSRVQRRRGMRSGPSARAPASSSRGGSVDVYRSYRGELTKLLRRYTIQSVGSSDVTVDQILTFLTSLEGRRS